MTVTQKQHVHLVVNLGDKKPKKKKRARKRKPVAPRGASGFVMGRPPMVPQVVYNSTSHLSDLYKAQFASVGEKLKALEAGQNRVVPKPAVPEQAPAPTPTREPTRIARERPVVSSPYNFGDMNPEQFGDITETVPPNTPPQHIDRRRKTSAQKAETKSLAKERRKETNRERRTRIRDGD